MKLLSLPAWPLNPLFFKLVLLCALCFNIYHLQKGIHNPLRELEHGFRQCQTASTTYWIIKDGFNLAYETPILGPDWRMPIELASFQYTTALIVNIFHSPLDITGRLVSIFYFYLSAVILYFILKAIKLDHHLVLLILSFVFINPNYCFWPRAFLYETTALCFSLGFVLFSIRFFCNQSPFSFALALLFGAIAAPTKITTYVIYAAFVVMLLAISFFQNEYKTRNILFFLGSLMLLVLPIFVSFLWNSYADSYKTNHLIAYYLTTKNHWVEWILWHLEGRTSLATWHKIISESMLIVKLFPLFILFYKLKYWKWAMASLFFWLLGPLLFTRLYYVHSYYNISNGLFMSAFVAFTLYGLLISRLLIYQLLALALVCFIAFNNHLKFQYFYGKSLTTNYNDIFLLQTMYRNW